jgi:hypothetical protein
MRASSPARLTLRRRARFAAIVATGVTGALLSGSPAHAASPQGPGTFAGKAFDTCAAPDQSTMDAWKSHSPFGAVGIYISGNSRACGGGANLTPGWVQTNADRGWRFLPLHVGYQSPCYSGNKKKMSSDVATARQQAQSDANETVAALRRFGFGGGSASYLDIEAYGRTTSCDNAVREFMDVWTETLHANGYLSGVYSSGYSGIALVNEAMLAGRAGFSAPDHIWFAHTNGQATTDAGGPYLSEKLFTNHQRIHQYDNGQTETFGGKTVNIDWNVVDIAATSAAGCYSADVARIAAGKRPSLQRGAKSAAVTRLQLALAATGRNVPATGKFGRLTAKAVKSYRKRNGLHKGTGVDKKVWKALQAGRCA